MNGVETCTPNKCIGLYRNLNYPKNWWELLHRFAHHRPTFWGTFVRGFLLTELFSIEGNLNLGRLWMQMQSCCFMISLWATLRSRGEFLAISSTLSANREPVRRLFCNLNLLLFWRSYCRRHLRCVNSLPHVLTGCVIKSGEASL